MRADNHVMQRRTGGPFSRLLASRSPVPADAYRYMSSPLERGNFRMKLVPADTVSAFPGAVYKLFPISHDHFLAVLDNFDTDDHVSDYLVHCFVAKMPPAHEIMKTDRHWFDRATTLEPQSYDRNNNVQLSSDGVPLIEWGSIKNYIANAKFDI